MTSQILHVFLDLVTAPPISITPTSRPERITSSNTETSRACKKITFLTALYEMLLFVLLAIKIPLNVHSRDNVQ